MIRLSLSFWHQDDAELTNESIHIFTMDSVNSDVQNESEPRGNE